MNEGNKKILGNKVKDNKIKDNKVKDNKVKDNNVKDNKVKDNNVKDNNVKNSKGKDYKDKYNIAKNNIKQSSSKDQLKANGQSNTSGMNYDTGKKSNKRKLAEFEEFEDFEDIKDRKEYLKSEKKRTQRLIADNEAMLQANKNKNMNKTNQPFQSLHSKNGSSQESRRNQDKNLKKDYVGSFNRTSDKSTDKGFNKTADKNYNKSTDIDFNKALDKNYNKSSEKNFNKVADKNYNKSFDKNLDRVSDKISEKKDKPSFQRDACPYLRECGGCNVLKQPYADSLKEKQKSVESLLKTYCRVEPIIGMKQPYNYRNKVHVVFDHDRKGNPITGVYEEGTHRVVRIEKCLIHNYKADEIIASIRGMLKSFKIKTYDEDSGYGLIRHILIRTGFASGQIMVVLVLGSPIFPSKNNFVKALLKLHPDITTIVVNVNDKQTSMVLGDKEQVIYGKGFIEDSLCGKMFRISPKSFYQVNPAQTEVIYTKAIEMAGLTGKETIVDAYCGIGTIGIIASDHVKKVIGVELNKDAVKDAVNNAKRNNASNIDFYSNDAGEFMTQMAEQKENVDVVFMDPPRTGSTEQFMDAVVLLKPNKVVYISCNPITLERDLSYLTKKGYKAQRAIPVDMFPWTNHVETCCLLYKVK